MCGAADSRLVPRERGHRERGTGRIMMYKCGRNYDVCINAAPASF